MKVVIGRRERPLAKKRTAFKALRDSVGALGGKIGFQRKMSFVCLVCEEEVEIIIKEDVYTGEVSIEALEECPNCGKEILLNLDDIEQISQEEIIALFGE